MEIIWDEKNREEFIDFCFKSLATSKGINLKYNRINILNDKYILWIQFKDGEYAHRSMIVPLKYNDIIDIVEEVNGPSYTIDLNNMRDELKLELGKFVIKSAWVKIQQIMKED